MRLVLRLVGRILAGLARRRQRLVGEFGDGQAVGELQRGLDASRPGASPDRRARRCGRPRRRCRACTSCRAPARRRSRRTAPSILTRWKPFFCSSASSLRYSPLRPRTIGASRIEPRAFLERQHAVDHLADGLALDRQAGGRRIGHADAREQQAHIVVDLGDGADRRARVARGRLLLDRDGRRQAVDLVDVRLLHHLQELARIGRQALDIAALALGIDRVEGERRFARARQAGHDDQPVARQVEIDVLEIVLARAANGNDIYGRPWPVAASDLEFVGLAGLSRPSPM